VSASVRRAAPRVLVWGVPVAILLHNIEEAVTVPLYLPRVRALAPAAVRSAIPDVQVFYVALVVVTAIPFGMALLAHRSASRGWATYGLLVVTAVMLVNVASHIGAAIWLGGYSPGVATAILVNLPVMSVALSQSRHRGLVSRRGIWRLFLVAVLLHGPILIGLFALVSLIA
jgi:Protein of unknown function with HXXEE motif